MPDDTRERAPPFVQGDGNEALAVPAGKLAFSAGDDTDEYAVSVPERSFPVGVGKPEVAANEYSRRKKFCEGCEPYAWL